MRSEDARLALDWVGDWVGSEALESVVRLYDGRIPEGLDLAGSLAWLTEFSDRWNFRQGKERNLVESLDFSEPAASVIFEAAEELGLRGSDRPQGAEFDHVVILGGLARACVSRPREAARLLGEGGVEAGHLVALGGFRLLKGGEEELVRDFLGVDVIDEYEAMDAGVRSAFGLGESASVEGERSEQLGASWEVRTYERDAALPVHVVAAPSSEPGARRANTADTYEWLASRSGWIEPESSMLIVTTNIYRPYQQADAIRMLTLPHGIEVEVFGGLPGASDPRLSKDFRPHDYLQEIRSTIASMSRLRAAIEERTAGG